MSRRRNPPSLVGLLVRAVKNEGKPVAVILAGHNGSGKSTLWQQRLVIPLRLPLVNADRITTSILLLPNPVTHQLPRWARELRDHDGRWHLLSQKTARAINSLVTGEKMPFAFETVFSHWKPKPDGGFESKADEIKKLQAAGYYCVLIFVGLASPEISVTRVQLRKEQGGHSVPLEKLHERFARTQQAIGHATSIADMTIMFDNSSAASQAFELVRVQERQQVLFDCRDYKYNVDRGTRIVARAWLNKVTGSFVEPVPSR